MKNVIAAGLAVALLIVVALFFGIGFGTGALAVAPPALTTSCDFGGLTFCVFFTTAPALGGNFASNWVNGISTPITFYAENYVGNTSCGSSPGWMGGSGNQFSYFSVQVIDSLTGSPVSLSSQSTTSFQVPSGATVTQSSTAFYVSLNNSFDQSAYCYTSPHITASSQSPQIDWTPVTFTLAGQFDDYSRISVQWMTKYDYCNGNAFSNVGQPSDCNQRGGGPYYASGSHYPVATAQAYLRSGGGYFSWNGQTVYNGQTFTVPVTTYYDAGQGFQIQFLYPSVRGSATISTQTVRDECTNCGVQFTVPSNAAQNSTDPQFNQFQMVLWSPVTQYGYEDIPIDISPLYAPPAPVVSYQDNQGNAVPKVGDTITVSISGTGIPAQGESIIGFNVWLWYLTPQTSAGTLPPNGNPAWITSGGQTGLYVKAIANGQWNGTATYGPFTISQPYSFAVQVESITNTAQTSLAQTAFTVYVQPPGCTGASCQKTPNSVGLWQEVGPWLLMIAFILAAALVALFVPGAPWIKFAVPAAVVAMLAVLYWLGFITGLFAQGGALY